MSSPHPVTIAFTDGAAKGNPGPGGWGAIVVTPDQHVAELGGGSSHTTNNKMELSGAIGALTHVSGMPGRVAIYTDSTYVIQGITQWVFGWRRKGWKTAQGGDVLNRDLWEALSELTAARGRGGVDWRWVRGHQGTPGNERCDEIAVAYAAQRPPDLYEGPLSGYGLALLDVPDEVAVPKRSTSAGLLFGTDSTKHEAPSRAAATARSSSAKAYSYLSVIGGVPMRHATWSECEQRVKGRSGARFKKSVSADDEAAILRGWGIDPRQV